MNLGVTVIMRSKQIADLFHKIQKWLNSPIQLQVQSFARRYYEFTNAYFCKKYSLDFNGFIPCGELAVDSYSSQANATAYQAYGSYYFKTLIGFAISMVEKPAYFVDIGCGKGKQCIYAEKYFGFDRIIGIDFSNELIDIANKNLFNLKYSNIEFQLADAADYKLPDKQCMVFLYNPFNEIILNKFVTNNIDNFTKLTSLIIYANDIHRKILTDFGFETIYRDHQNNSVFKVKDVLIRTSPRK